MRSGSVLLHVTRLSLFLVTLTLFSFAQDSRTVTEPVFPTTCTVLTAQLPTVNGDLALSSENSFDTTRIQNAINACPQGQAVELAADSSGNNAFLIQPINLVTGVTLLVDPGVTVFASRNPRDYDVQAGSCGIVASSSKGCFPIINVSSAPNAAIMGYGVINGRGGDTLLGPGAPANTSWWDLASQAQQQNLTQFVPKLLVVNGSSNFTLYKITLTNSPMFHVAYSGGTGVSGFTAWDVKIIAPFSARNTDGIDPGNATDVTITNSYISDGDDNVAVGASHTLSSNISVVNNHFYSGHGMSIGSFTGGGVQNMVVDNVQFAGNASDPNANGIRIKSANDRGGTISNVSYSHICIQNIRNPLQFNPFYNTNTGTLIPYFQSITLSNVHVLSEGKVQLDGADATHPLGLTLDNVVFDTLLASDLTPAPQNANVTLGPGPVSSNLANNISGTNVTVTNNITNPSQAPYDCSHAFVYLAGELTGPTATVTQGQLVNLIAIVQPVVSGAAMPTGSVQILEGASVVGTATLSGTSDLLAISLPNVTTGTHTYTAVYSGDSHYASLPFGSFTVTVTPNSLASTTTQLTGVPASATFGSSIPVTATVSSSSTTPTGTVTFLQGNNQLATVALVSGQASFTITGLSAGSYQISAAYNGDVNFAGSVSAASPLTITAAATTTSLSSSASQVTAGSTVALSTTVSSSAGTPTGSVAFMDGATQIGTAPLVNGGATVNAALGVGVHSITAVYAGTQNYATSTSSAVTVTVTAGAGATASILPFPLPYLITTVAGGAAANCAAGTSVGDGCPATQVVLSSDLRAVAADRFGNVFIDDTNNSRIRMVNAATSIISTFAGGGTPCVGKTDTYGDGCPSSQTGNFNHPRGLWIDSAGNVFIAGYNGNVVHKVQASNGIMVMVAGMLSNTTGSGSGVSGVGGENIPATTSNLNAPRGVWTDTNGNIYIADTGNNRIRVVYQGGVIPNVATPVVGNIYTLAGSLTGATGFGGDGGPANAAAVLLKTPQGGATDPNGNVFIADGNGRIRVIYMAGTLVANLIAAENSGATAQVGFIYTIAGGSSTAYTVPVLATKVAVGGPQKLYLDAGNNIYISDSSANSVWFVDSRSGFIRRLVGGATSVCAGATDTIGDGCPATQATLSSGGNGIGVTLDVQGNLYVTDTSDLRVRKVSSNTQFNPTAVGSNATQTVLMHFIVNDSPAASNPFTVPAAFHDFSLSGSPTCTFNTDTTTDCLLQMQFAPQTPGVRSAPFTVNSTAGSAAHIGLVGQGLGSGGVIDPATLLTIGQSITPQGVAVDSGLNVYVADGSSKQVLKYAAGSNTGTTVINGLSDPHGVAVDSAGNVYVADAGAGKVLQAAADGSVKSVGTGLTTPKGVAVDPLGNIYIADAAQTKLIKVSSDLAEQTTVGSGFTAPASVAVDANFNVYAVDSGTGIVTKIPPSGSSSAVNSGATSPTAVAADAAGDVYVSDAGAQSVIEVPSAASTSLHNVVSNLTTPAGVAVDGIGNLYVADSSDTKIVEMERTQGVFTFPDNTTIFTAVLSNIGNQAIVPSGSGFTQTDATDFNLSTSGSGGCNFSANINSGSVCTLTAQFTPTTNGALADVATLTGNYANLALAPFQTLNLTLNGAGSVVFPTQTTIAPISPASPVFGQTITLAATVTSTGGTPTGSLTFAIDGNALAPLLLDGSGSASTTVSNVTAGSHTLTAIYSGSTQFSGSTGTPVPFTVAKAGTSITWTPPSNSIVYGTTLASTLNATGSVPGTIAYTAQIGSGAPFAVTGTTVLPVGSYQLNAVFTPTDSTDYFSSTASVSLTVTQATTNAGLGVTQSVVAADGSGNFTTLSAGLGSLPAGGGALYIKSGSYKEANVISKPHVSLYGLGGNPPSVILTDDLSAGPNNFNPQLGDKGSATVQALGDDFYADFLTFQNTFDLENNQDTTPNAQALAVWVTGDRAIFNNSRFLSRQDTVFGGSKGCNSTTCTSARQYFFQAYVEGNVDYIFGDGATVFESSTIHSDYHGTASGEATITAQNKKFPGSNYLSGEVFSNCTLTSENDAGAMTNLYLGRPWGTYSTNVYLNTNMQAPIKGAGWIEFTPGTTNNLPTSFYAEYNSTGPGSLGPREAFAVQLDATTAAPWQPLTFLAGTDSWNPQTTLAQRAAAVVPAVQTLTVPQGASLTLISRIAPAVGGSPTGTVQFLDNGSLLTTVNVDASLEATLTTSSLPVGVHPITIQYSGDTNFVASTSAVVTITVIPATTTLSLTLSSSTPTYGDVVTATATVSSGGAGTPTGTVTFSVDGNALTPVTLTGNSASQPLPLAALGVGPHSVTASYSGDANFDPATAGPTSLTVSQASTTTAVVSSANPSVFGQSVTFTATVSPQFSGVATGTVQFMDGAGTLGSPVTLDGSGQAQLNLASLSPGPHSISAVYGGDTNFTASTSSAVAQVVNPGSTTTIAVSSVNPSVFGQSVTFTATVAAVAPAAGVPTGTVSFMDGANNIGSRTLDGNGAASFTTSALSVGSHNITAVYSGDTNFATSTSNTVAQVVNQGSTQGVVTSSASPSVFGQSITLTATITAAAPAAGIPTGTVTFKDGTNILDSATLDNNGVATLPTSALSVGSHNITAVYQGDANFTGVTSPIFIQTVNAASTTTSLTSSVNPSVFGQSVTFTATVAVTAPGAGTPTGSVTFFDGGSNMGPGTLDGSGVATLTTSTLSVGSHNITASYGGDTNFAMSTSSTVAQTVNQGSTQGVVSSSASPSVFGQSVTLTATITAVAPAAGLPTGTVMFKDGTTSLGSGTLTGGIAILPIATLSVGSHNITAVYSGDTNFTIVTSPIFIQTVNAASTTTSLTSSVNPSAFGQSVTFTATAAVIAPGAGTPTGTVTFLDGTTNIGTGTLNGSGVATFTTSALTAGSHAITASYATDGNFNSSTGALPGNGLQVVGKANTTTAIASSVNPSNANQAVTFTATVGPIAPGAGVPTGTVQFMDGASALGAPQTLTNGQTTFTTSSLSVGTHAITAVYNGDGSFTSSTSSVLNQAVGGVDVAVTLIHSPEPVHLGGKLSFVASIANNGPSSTNVTFSESFVGANYVVSTHATQGTCNVVSGNVNCNLGQMTNGATAMVTVVVTPIRLARTIAATATVSSDVTDSTPDNNTATSTAKVRPFPWRH